MAKNPFISSNIVQTTPYSEFINFYDYNKLFRIGCRTCSLVVQEKLSAVHTDSTELNKAQISLRNTLYLCCPELDLHITSKEILCVNCFEIINIINKFIHSFYKSKGYVKEQNNFAFASVPTFSLLGSSSQALKNEIKTEEIDLSDTEISFEVKHLQAAITANKLNIIKKCTPKNDISIQNEYVYITNTHNKRYIVFHKGKESHDYKYASEKEIKYPQSTSVILRQPIPIGTTKKLFKCPYCDYNSKYKNYLKRHIYTHSKVKPFKCSYCDYSNVRMDRLKMHISIHTGEKPFKCSHCDYSSIQMRHLKIHMFVHTGEKPFKCSQCDFSSTRKDCLKTHMLIHTGEKPFKCSQCDYGSILRGHLKRHLLIHSGEKPFKCTQCNFSSTHKESLKMHTRIHTGEKPFKCSYCNYSCIQMTNLNSHLRNHTGDKPFKCSHCNFNSTRKESLKTHMYIHTGEKPFKCSQCNYSSTLKVHLKNHILTHIKKKPLECSH